jgi:sulfide:quinone oxidoreductase
MAERDTLVHAPLLLHTALTSSDAGGVEPVVPIRPMLEEHGVEFRCAKVTALDLARRRVATDQGDEAYDRLVFALGAQPDRNAVPGLDRDDVHALNTPAEAEALRTALARLVARPGPLVVALAEGASAYAAAYRLALHVARRLGARAPVTVVTPEPHPGHFGVGGVGEASEALDRALAAAHVHVVPDARIASIEPGAIRLDDDRVVPFAQAVITLRNATAAWVRASCPDVLDGEGFVRVDDCYRIRGHDDVFAAGALVAITAADGTRVRCGVPRTPSMAAEMGVIAGENAAASVRGTPLLSLPPAALIAERLADPGVGENLTAADPFLDPRPSVWSREQPDLERMLRVLEQMRASGPRPSAATR